MWVDTHAHLHTKEFDADRDRVIRRALANGVDWIVDVGTDVRTSRMAVRIAETHGRVIAASGIHPHDAAAASEKDFSELEILWSHPRVRAVGEIGLDYHYAYSPPALQKEVFEKQLRIAAAKRLPAIIHVRKAMPDALAILRGIRTDGWRGVFHCYGGGAEDVPEILRMGFFLSFTGVVTFSNFSKANVVRGVPLERLLLETDAPYMAPVPWRGRRNEPSYLVHTAHALSAMLQVAEERVAEQTTRNAVQLFGLENETCDRTSVPGSG
jgi:TatD DNase family protein